MAGLIAMSSAVIVVAIEMFLTTRGAGHSHSHVDWEDEHDVRANGVAQAIQKRTAGSNQRYSDRQSGKSNRQGIALHDFSSSERLVSGQSEDSPVPNGKPYQGSEDSDNESTHSDLDLSELDPGNDNGLLPTDTESQPEPDSPETRKRQLLQCLLLEAGILFHSIFIGMAISVTTGPPFLIFLIAIAFHQTFEGVALGTRIASISFPPGSLRPYLMVLAYGTTTPIGQAIGLAVHNMYDPYSQTGLLMVGVMNAISSGLLLFAGLVQLLAEDFLSEKSYSTLKGEKRLHAFLAVIGGATLMALVGAWA
jgi:zinc transporter 1/2/3